MPLYRSGGKKRTVRDRPSCNADRDVIKIARIAAIKGFHPGRRLQPRPAGQLVSGLVKRIPHSILTLDTSLASPALPSIELNTELESGQIALYHGETDFPLFPIAARMEMKLPSM